MSIEIELQEIERNINLLFELVKSGKISDDDYEKLSAYPYRRQIKLKNKLEQLKNNQEVAPWAAFLILQIVSQIVLD